MIVIIDYGLGNIRAFANVYKRLNIPVRIARNAGDLDGAQKIILPGVGAFDQAMTMLNTSGMREKLEESVLMKKIPVLGICVGMQILGRKSAEGKLEGLGWIDGRVELMDIASIEHRTKLPHMGWNIVKVVKENSIFPNETRGHRYYFLHSYFFHCENDEDIIAVSEYGDEFPCAINRQNIYGVQFHPEKSHSNGVNLLKKFGSV